MLNFSFEAFRMKMFLIFLQDHVFQDVTVLQNLIKLK